MSNRMAKTELTSAVSLAAPIVTWPGAAPLEMRQVEGRLSLSFRIPIESCLIRADRVIE